MTLLGFFGELTVTRFLKFATPALLLCSAAPAFAQENETVTAPTGEKVNQLIIYGDDKCPPSTDDVINVCAVMDEGERYRIPGPLRGDLNDLNKEAWTNRVKSYEYIGKTGTMSCSAVGAGGFTGCGLKEIDKAYAEKKQDPGIAFGLMIAEERKKRLAGIDAEAAEVEKRVEQFEKDREAREAQEAATRDRLNAEDANGTTSADDEPLPEPKPK